MDLSASTVWWLAAGAVVAAELATGTFYLLMIALGLSAGALAAHAGLTFAAELIIAALVGGGATALWHFKRGNHTPSLPVSENHDVNLDVGERVHVTSWAADRTARVQYRGTNWTARLQPGAEPMAGDHVIAAVEGNWLVLKPAQPL